MPLKTIGIKSLRKGLKSKKFRKYAPKAVKAGLYGTGLLATGNLGKKAFHAGHLYSTGQASVTILDIVRTAYKSDSFYKASWKIKGKILAKQIINNSAIQTNILEGALAQIIYELLKKNKNRQGTDKLAHDIELIVMDAGNIMNLLY